MDQEILNQGFIELITLVKSTGRSYKKIAEDLGTSPQMLSNILKGRNQCPLKTYSRAFSIYPAQADQLEQEISLDKSGQRADIIMHKLQEISLEIKNLNQIQEPDEDYHIISDISSDHNKSSLEDPLGIPLIPMSTINSTRASALINSSDMDHDTTLDRFKYPAFSDCQIAITISGDDMYPDISAGDVAVLKVIRDRSIIPYGQIFYLSTQDLNMIRRIRKLDSPDHLLLTATNPNFDDIIIELDAIQDLYLVKGIIKKSAQ